MSRNVGAIAAVWAGVILSSLVAMQLLFASKLAAVGAIEAAAISDLKFVFHLLAMNTLGLMFYGLVTLSAGWLTLVEDDLHSVSWLARGTGFLLLVVVGFVFFGIQFTREISNPEHLEALRSVGLLVSFVVASPLITVLFSSEELRGVPMKLREVMA